MGINTFPAPSSTPTPPGAGTLVAQGLANAGAYMANLSAGSYVIDCKGYGTNTYPSGFTINSSRGVTGKKVQSGTHSYTNPVYVKLDNADPAFTILSQPNTTGYNSMVYNTSAHMATNGSGTWLIVTSNGTDWISYKSIDYGATWAASVTTGLNVATSASIIGFTYVNGIWFLLGSSGWQTRSSDNGATWSSSAQVGTTSAGSIAYGASTYVMAAQGTTTTTNIYSSTDGATWTARTASDASAKNSVAFGAGVFVAVGNSGSIMTSTNGTTWTARTSGTTTTLRNVVYAAGLFVAIGGTVILTSPDGTTWTSRETGSSNGQIHYNHSTNGLLVYGGGYFWAQDSITANVKYKSMLMSSDGITWTKCMQTQVDQGSTSGPGNLANEYGIFSSASSAIYDSGFYTVNGNSTGGTTLVLNRFMPMYVSIYSVSGTALN